MPDSNEYAKYRTCYATYTHAKNLAKFKENYENSSVITTETNSRITRTTNMPCKLQFRYVYLYSEQLLVLKKTVFDSFFLNYIFKKMIALKYLIDGGMLIDFNFQRLFRFPS